MAAIGDRRRTRYGEYVANRLVKLRDAESEGAQSVRMVEEEFGAVADEIVILDYKYHVRDAKRERHIGTTAMSWHSAVVEVVRQKLDTALYMIGFFEGLSSEVGEELFHTFTVEDLLTRCGENIRKLGTAILGIPPFLPSGTRDRLKRELFRAWKRKYPDERMKYERLGDDANSLAAAFRRDRRPAYGRDHFFLSLKEESGLTPARIRDLWDSMTDEDRRTICPECWGQIGDACKNAGRDVVKKALKRACEEAQLERT
jgi:hypothetical protein